MRFSGDAAEDYMQNRYPSDSWLFRTQQYPVDMDNDIAIIVKTGYGTRRRVPVALAALSNETFFADTVVVQDFPIFEEHQISYQLANGKPVPAVDVVGWNLERGVLNSKTHLERISKYRHLAEAIEAEEWALSDGIGMDIGWELDALKVRGVLSI